jgi:hypothetical protein
LPPFFGKRWKIVGNTRNRISPQRNEEHKEKGLPAGSQGYKNAGWKLAVQNCRLEASGTKMPAGSQRYKMPAGSQGYKMPAGSQPYKIAG